VLDQAVDDLRAVRGLYLAMQSERLGRVDTQDLGGDCCDVGMQPAVDARPMPINLSLVIGAQVKHALAPAGVDHIVIAVHRLRDEEPGERVVVQTAQRPGRDKGLRI